MKAFKQLWKHRFFRVLTYIFGSLVTLYVLFYAWVNYSGAKQWAATQEMLKREGESLSFQVIALPPVPEDKNFCAIPALKDLSLLVDSDPLKGEPAARRKRLEEVTLPAEKGPQPAKRPAYAQGSSLGTPVDLKAWADWLSKEGSPPSAANSANAARDVLAAFAKHDALFAELAAGLNRPEAHWTPEWKTREIPEMLFAVPMPHYQPAQHLVTVLTLRAAAAARAGDAVTAHQSLLIALRLARASLNDPFLIGELVAASQSSQICAALWELCDAHVGTPEDFQRLQEELAKLDFEPALLRSYREELASGVNAVIWLKRRMNPEDLDLFYGMTDGPKEHASVWGRLLFKMIPGGFFYMNASNIAELEFTHLIKPLRDGGLRGGLDQGSAMEEKVKNIPRYRIDMVFAKLTAPVYSNLIVRSLYTQSIAHQAVAACALERWFSQHHSYPDSLEALGPLPGAPLTGKPMGYHKTSDGKYALWCIGPDRQDHGGKRVLDAKKPESTKFSKSTYKGDWVWSYQPGE